MPYNFITPLSMLPPSILNWNLVKAVVVLKYPAVNIFAAWVPLVGELLTAIKCLTKVVDDGLNICK